MKHPGVHLMLLNAEESFNNYNLPADTNAEPEEISVTTGYGDVLVIQVRNAEVPTDNKLEVTWTEHSGSDKGRDYTFTAAPQVIHGGTLPPSEIRQHVESLSLDVISKVLEQDLSGSEPTRAIFSTAMKSYDSPIVKRAVHCWLAYRLGTMVRCTKDEGRIHQSEGLEAPTSKLHGQIPIAPSINLDIRRRFFAVWQEIRGELELHFQSPNQGHIWCRWLALAVLLANNEDLEFDCKYRELWEEKLAETSRQVGPYIDKFLAESGFNSTPPGGDDVAHRGVLEILHKSQAEGMLHLSIPLAASDNNTMYRKKQNENLRAYQQ
ncbi:Fc.00g082130.m01.CDS01 [Cosmosporella sp. VM-42]